MARPHRPLRLFVGVFPPAAVARGLVAAAATVAPPGGEPIDAASVHLTVHHVGRPPSGGVAGVLESIERAASGLAPFDLTPLRLVSLPRGGPVRLLGAQTDEPSPLMELQRRLAVRFARGVRARPGERYTPRLALVRYAPAVEELDIDAACDVGTFSVDRVLVMEATVRAGRSALWPVGEVGLTA